MKKVIILILLFGFCFSPLAVRAESRPPTILEKLATERRERASAYIERITRGLKALVDYDEILLARVDLAIYDAKTRGDDTYKSAAFAMSAHDEIAEGSSALASTTELMRGELTDELLLTTKNVLIDAQSKIETAHDHIGKAIEALF